jgi:purine nucleoside phosphorylase
LKKVDVAILGGTGLEALLDNSDQVLHGTPHGLSPSIFLGEISGKTVAFLPHHGVHHEVRKTAQKNVSVLEEILREAVLHLPEKRKCLCAHTLEWA